MTTVDCQAISERDGDEDEDQQSIAKMVLKEKQDSQTESSNFHELYKGGLSADK